MPAVTDTVAWGGGYHKREEWEGRSSSQNLWIAYANLNVELSLYLEGKSDLSNITFNESF